MTFDTGPTYTNPIINSDCPDPDVIRVGEWYYMVTSSFNRSPGLPVYRSRDLLDWEIIANAAPAVEPFDANVLPRPGAGLWAPSIRHHGGLLYIFAPDPDRGILVYTAANAEGPWSAPHTLLAGPGFIDPCPLWDDDGRAWLVFGWARSRAGFANRLSMIEMSSDATRTIGEIALLIDGENYPGYTTLEGPKVYRRDGWYWIFAPAGGVAEGWQAVFRSRSLHGPYEYRTVLEQGRTPINGPHQGAWVTSPSGEDWFLHFQDRGPYGRVLHLQPMTWNDDGWPTIGRDGEPVIEHPAPREYRPIPSASVLLSDDWTDPRLGPRWHWQANVRPDRITLAGDGSAHLALVGNDIGNLKVLPQILGQPIPGYPARITTTVTLTAGHAQARAGLTVLGESYVWVGIQVDAAGRQHLAHGEWGPEASGENTVLVRPLQEGETVPLEILSDGEGWVRRCSVDAGGERVFLGEPFAVSGRKWVSAEIGMFAAAPFGASPVGDARFGPIHCTAPPE